jgi:hypothetical protein
VTTERFEVDPAIDLKRYEEEAFGCPGRSR